MDQELFVALEISDGHLVERIRAALAELPKVRIFGRAERAAPHILILEDRAGAGDVFQKMELLRTQHPQVPLFVLSEDKRPEHIIEVMKAGAAEFLFCPPDVLKLKEAVEKVRSRLASPEKTSRGRLYSFIGSKGGLGATVTAVNTAAAMAMSGESSVALLDLSLQAGDGSALLDIVPQTTIADLCKNYHRLDYALLQGAMTKHATGLGFLAAPVNPEDSALVEAGHLKKILHLLKGLYDQVIVDCTSMSVSDCSLEAFQASDRIFIITDLSVPAIRNASRLLKLIQKNGISPQKIEIVVNRFIKGKTLTIDEIEETLKRRVFWLLPNDFDETIVSINRGVPLVRHNPKAALSKNVQEFIEKLNNSAVNQDYRGLKGLFGKAV
ncbi:pilus assembly protein CpaE [Desulfuromonas versatilis]|uniref:Pilus assembly protein CpaE n=1 Tax=Desulfuromonas versatilis TaxID=2802975 RepID=A0ABM8HS78_9BACT|nr:AAA family ATPase [Desulfuromonas versatilis]BCR03454.1 pilus assembly protein CpaE [Desulfuromonas versatilis]